MIRRFLSGLVVFCASVCGACALWLWWTGYFAEPKLAALVCSDPNTAPLYTEMLRASLEDLGYRFEVREEGDDLTIPVRELLSDGAEVILLALDHRPENRLFLNSAVRAGTTMIFVQTSPGGVLLSSYDKAWEVIPSASQSGELLGDTVAALFRDGTLPDRNGNHLLDYVTLTDAEDSEAAAVLAAVLTECEHYGVYSADNTPVPPELTEEEQLDAKIDAELAAENGESVPDTAPTLAEQWIDLAAPELLLCTGYANACAALEAAKELNWLTGSTPTALAAAVENEESARLLEATGAFCSIVYTDCAAITDTVLRMSENALNANFIADGLHLTQTSASSFTIPSRKLPVYWTAENALEAAAESSADETAAPAS